MENKGIITEVFQIPNTEKFLVTLKGLKIWDVAIGKELKCGSKTNFIDSIPMLSGNMENDRDITVGILNNEFRIGDVLEVL